MTAEQFELRLRHAAHVACGRSHLLAWEAKWKSSCNAPRDAPDAKPGLAFFSVRPIKPFKKIPAGHVG